MKKIMIFAPFLSILMMGSCVKKNNNVDSKSLLRQNNPGPQTTSHLPPKDNPAGCLVENVNQTSENIGGRRIDDALLYSFRDNFLGGRMVEGGYIDRTGYIEYYYVLSEFVIKYGILCPESFDDCFLLLKYGEQVANTAMYGDENSIVVTSEIYAFCKKQSARLHNDLHFGEINEIVTELDRDLEYLNGKSQKDFVAYFH